MENLAGDLWPEPDRSRERGGALRSAGGAARGGEGGGRGRRQEGRAAALVLERERSEKEELAAMLEEVKRVKADSREAKPEAALEMPLGAELASPHSAPITPSTPAPPIPLRTEQDRGQLVF